ncbi:MAG: imidazole glycerol phosphate synthase subunit HisH [Bacillota bacterium]|nr:imidazole glycerol phosphate synthase subunit HisH [Bacillota bacterium]
MIAILDYGMGNLRSVHKACEYAGLPAVLTDDVRMVENAGKIIIPGVGAFSDAMAGLQSTGLADAVKRAAKEGKYILGICIGMQVLFEKGREGGDFDGLGLIPGEVVRLNAPRLKIPHMGWNMLEKKGDPIFDSTPGNPYVYFVHSYRAACSDEDVIAYTGYGERFPAAVRRGNIYGFQFHPEKSGETGLKLLKNFGGLK